MACFDAGKHVYGAIFSMDRVCRYNSHRSSHAIQQTSLSLPSSADLSTRAHSSIGSLDLVMRDSTE